MFDMTTEEYIQNGFDNNDCESITEYLEFLADIYNVPVSSVRDMARILGPDELFDGLVVEMQDVERRFRMRAYNDLA